MFRYQLTFPDTSPSTTKHTHWVLKFRMRHWAYSFHMSGAYLRLWNCGAVFIVRESLESLCKNSRACVSRSREGLKLFFLHVRDAAPRLFAECAPCLAVARHYSSRLRADTKSNLTCRLLCVSRVGRWERCERRSRGPSAEQANCK